MKFRAILFSIISLLFLSAAAMLAFRAYLAYQQIAGRYPPESTIAGIPVGGLDRQTAGTRVAQVYALTPVELRYLSSRVHIDPASMGQSLELESMLAQAETTGSRANGWNGFWDYLWNRTPQPFTIPLDCRADSARLRQALPDLFEDRYGQSPTAAYPIPGDSSFLPGKPGELPDLDSVYSAVGEALCSPDRRSVEIAARSSDPLPPQIDQLPLVLEGLTQVHGFNGTLELYYQDLQSGDSFTLALNQGRQVEPGIAFTAASTIKIPVMVSTYKRIEGEIPPVIYRQVELMIDLSENSSTDAVMMQALDPVTAPLQVSADMRALGLENTFLAGFFYLGAPLLDIIQTPANQRDDISTDPDIYNQTTASDMGRLLASLQTCADDGTGLLIEAFGGQVTPQECQAMLDLLAANRKGVLVEVGVPDGTRVAHKYGWVIDPRDGLMHAASDAAVVYTPGGNYVLTIYLYHPDQLHWDAAQRLAGRLSTAVYNFHNQWRE